MNKFLIILCFALVGCKELTGEYTGANDIIEKVNLIGGRSYTAISTENFLLDGTMDNGGNSGHLFKLKFNLPESEKLDFYFYSSRALDTGFKVSFSKDNGKVTFTLKLNSITHSRVLTEVSGDIIDIAIDIHNDHSDAHVIMWNGDGPYDDDDMCVDDSKCLYNTEYYTDPNPDPFDPGPWGTQGKASGVYWGFEGDKDLIINLEGPLKVISNA